MINADCRNSCMPLVPTFLKCHRNLSFAPQKYVKKRGNMTKIDNNNKLLPSI